MKNKKSIIGVVLITISAFALLTGCSNGDPQKATTSDDKKALDSNKSTIFQVGAELFSIPSPVQTAFLIKSSGANYNKEILNDSKKATSYATKVQRGLNLGVYGADLGYITIYEQTQDAIEYIGAARQIADELGVSSAFNASLIKRFERNLGNRDSILVMVSDAYRSADSFLKDNERDDVGSMVLAGGWIEAIYFATKVAETNPTPAINRRIGEQQKTLENLIKLLQKYSTNEEFSELIDELIDLYYLFDDVEYDYVYKEPSTDIASKTTTINSLSEVSFSNEQLQTISKKIQSIRNQIVN